MVSVGQADDGGRGPVIESLADTLLENLMTVPPSMTVAPFNVTGPEIRVVRSD